MDMNEVQKNFVAVFFKEWELFLKNGDDASQPSGEVAASREAPFDAPVKVGEIRLFAESKEPLVGLVLAEDSAEGEGYLVVPISPFTVPATEQEILIGKRVYQLWNSFTAPLTSVSKSWIVDTLSAEDMKDVARSLSAVLAHESMPKDLGEFVGLPIVQMDDPRLDYEKRFDAKHNFSLRTPH